ncbi:MAG: ATP-binding protein [Spirochaetia bacterium]|nr:ATP-binding protein [Spirochaetia bacterium]
MNDPFPTPDLETRDKVRLQIPSHPRYVALARDFVYRLCLSNGFSTGVAFDMKIISGEALANIIQHSYAGNYDQPILIDFKLYPGFAELRFRDFGRQLPVTATAAHDLSDYRERGLGIFLIQNLSDYHYYDQSFKVGTELVLKKKVS